MRSRRSRDVFFHRLVDKPAHMQTYLRGFARGAAIGWQVGNAGHLMHEATGWMVRRMLYVGVVTLAYVTTLGRSP